MPKGKKFGGRTKGTPNKSTTDVAAAARALVEDPVYRAGFKARLQAGELAPALEVMVWHFSYGKPVDHIQVSGEGGGPMVKEVRFVMPA